MTSISRRRSFEELPHSRRPGESWLPSHFSGDQAGHGSMQYAESLEPQIREGTVFGQMHFQSNEGVIQDGAGDYMAPIDNDPWGAAVAQRAAIDNARIANQSSLYAAFLGH